MSEVMYSHRENELYITADMSDAAKIADALASVGLTELSAEVRECERLHDRDIERSKRLAQRCTRCNHDCSEYEGFTGLCAACEAERDERTGGGS